MSGPNARFGRNVPDRGSRRTDLVCIGRGIADLYADQLGGRLEEAISFSAYVGGSALNICVGVQRLGLQTAMILRVGDDHMGRLVSETLRRNGVDTAAVHPDPKAPTPLCILGVRDRSAFPRDMFTDGAAYLNLTEDDIDPALFRDARALLINGSFFTTQPLRAACRRALALAREAGCATALDIDYRPALWGLVGHGSGEMAFVESAHVTESFSEFLNDFDLVVGTEQEIAIVGGSTDSLTAVRAIRDKTDATIVLKRGPLGCVAFDGDVPDDVEKGKVVPGFKIKVMNTAGAGDSFMAGVIAGWLNGRDVEESCRLGNACGAVNVARHGCSDSAPSEKEIAAFLAADGIEEPDRDPSMRNLHALLGRMERRVPSVLLDLTGGPSEPEAVESLLKSHGADGILWDETDSFAELASYTGRGLWVARRLSAGPAFSDGLRIAAALRRWPREHILWIDAEREGDPSIVASLTAAAQDSRHEVAVDIGSTSDPAATARMLTAAGCRPEWWVLASSDPAVETILGELDVEPRGVILRDRSVTRP